MNANAPSGVGAGRRLFYFGHAPLEGSGSPVILLRHLERFAEAGWRITIVPQWGQDVGECTRRGWDVVQVPVKRPGWPPYDRDQPLLRRLRAWLWGGCIGGAGAQDAVLTYLSAFSFDLSIAAVGFALRKKLPVVTIVHDDAGCFAERPADARRAMRLQAWVSRKSTFSWFASEELRRMFPAGRGGAGVLPPIPEGGTGGRPSRPATGPVVYAGSCWPCQLPLLARIAQQARDAGTRLVCVFRRDETTRAWAASNQVELLDPWPSNRDALKWFAQHAGAMLVSYSERSEEMPWSRTSFPSKLVEYSHLGIPVCVVAPADTAVARWAKARSCAFAFDPSDTAAINAFLLRVAQGDLLETGVRHLADLAQSEFDPARIHSMLEFSLSSRVP